MKEMTFRKAERKKARLRLALCGVSGSGKTYSSILLAKGLGGKIAMIDTENGSGELYAHIADYDVLTITAPYSPEKYVDAIKAAEKAGYTTVIIDSLSHAWVGIGGILDMHDKATEASRSKNSYTAWRDVTPAHNALVDAILTSPLHIIATMRSKTAYESQKNETGKVTPVKVGLAPVQRDGMEYEFTVVLDLSTEKNIATASKDRTQLFTGKYVKISEETGTQLLNWLNTGKDVDAEVNSILGQMESSGSIADMKAIANEARLLAKASAPHRMTDIKGLHDKLMEKLSPVNNDDWTDDYDKGHVDVTDAESMHMQGV